MDFEVTFTTTYTSVDFLKEKTKAKGRIYDTCSQHSRSHYFEHNKNYQKHCGPALDSLPRDKVDNSM